MPKEIEGKDADEWRGDGNACISSKNYQQAIECFENAIEIGFKDKIILKMTLYSTGSAYYFIENYHKAIEYYNKVVKKDSNFVYAWYGLGLAYSKTNNYKKAINCYEKSLMVDPKKPVVLPNRLEAWKYMGNAYKELKNYGKAIDCYKNALEINPDIEEVKDSLKILEPK